jgi:hypothetical protein
LIPQASPGGEQLVRIDIAEPPEEVLLGLVFRRSVDGDATAVERRIRVVAALERRLALLDRASFRVPFAHPGSLLLEGR